MKLVVVVALLLVSPVSFQTRTDQTPNLQLAFVRVERIGEATARSFFVFSTSVRNYAIRHDGHAEGSSLTTLRKNFDLKMGGAGRLESLYFVEYEGDLLLEYEVTDPRGNWGYLLRMDQKSMKFRWITPLNGNNLGPGLIDGQQVYLTAASLVVKLELRSGDCLWQQSQIGGSSAFSLPMLKGEILVFREDREVGRTIEVEKSTGQIIKH